MVSATLNESGKRDRTSFALFVGILSLLVGVAAGPTADRIIDQQPYDELTLKEDGTTFKLVPFELEQRRRLNDEKEPQATLLVRLQNRPDQRYQIKWVDILRVRLFEELVLEEAAGLVEDNKFDGAYEYYEYLDDAAPDFPGVPAARQACMFREAEFWVDQGRHRNALAILNELHEKAPQFSGLNQVMGQVVDHLVEQYLSSGKDAAARQLLADLESKFEGHLVAKKREQQLVDRATKILGTASAAIEGGLFRKANEANQEALAVWPDLKEARRLEGELNRRYPIASIGVRRFAELDESGIPSSWPMMRYRRLVDRHLFEPVAFTLNGGDYKSPFGKCKVEENRLVFHVAPGVSWPGSTGPVSGMDIARQLLARDTDINGHDGISQYDWAEAVHVLDDMSVELKWRYEPPLWKALLQTAPVPWTRSGDQPDIDSRIGPYREAERGAKEVRFLLKEDYFAIGQRQPREIVQRRFDNTLSAAQALRDRQILAIDRVAAWELEMLRGHSDVNIVKYAAPTVHMLLPNPRSKLLASGVVRRAIAYGVNREQILKEVLGDGQSPGGQVLSGPFPRGYGYDKSVPTRAWDPRLAVALMRSDPDGRSPGDELQTVTLAHPPSDVARRAAEALRDQLHLSGLGLTVQLREVTCDKLTEDKSTPWDLYFVQWCAMEPLVDASTLFDVGGEDNVADLKLESALKKLANAPTLSDAISILHVVHQHVHEHLNVIPLWQIDEYMAVHSTLKGVGDHPVTLYQDVEKWQVTLK